MADMMIAGDAELARILDDTYPIWNEGLSRDGYARWNVVQSRSAWGAAHLRRMALVESGEILASAKWYDLEARLDGQPIRVLGIGAVFTPESQRGRGHAATLMNLMMADAERQGYQAAALFSEIGAEYYERMGFTAIPRETVTLDVIQKKGAPASLVRAGDETDLKHIAALHETSDAVARLWLPRTPDRVQFAVTKKRTQSALAPIGSRTTEFYVSEEGNHAVAYVLITRGPSGNLADGPDVMWLEACGDRDPTGARVGAILQVLLARTPAETPPTMLAWLPTGWVPPQVRIASRAPAADILMLKALGATPLPALHGSEVIWWKADYF
jgi:GNAT superfamily N-acetyltransferase